MGEYERHAPSQQEPYSGWSDIFIEKLRRRVHGDNLSALVEPKLNVAEAAANFAGEHMPPDALEVAKIAHIAELTYHSNLGPNVRRSLNETFNDDLNPVSYGSWHYSDQHMPLKYTFGLMRDFPIIADFTRSHEATCRTNGHEYVDIEGLVGLVERTNFESIIIKAALDYSNFQYLDAKDYLSDKEKAKMRRIITAIKTVDSPLLALTGFDALEAEILSKAYVWELEQSGNGFFVTKANEVFKELGGRQELARTTETFLEDLFVNDSYTHSRVTAEQERYEMFFSNGLVTFPGSDNEYRVMARLKSTGATAKKMHYLYNKSEILETPMDIIGITLIAADEASMAICLQNVMQRLATTKIEHRAAPSRYEQVHIKGGPGFLEQFGSTGEHASLYGDLSSQDEACSNGYEAVKLTMLYEHNGTNIPIEVQLTHETARAESRSGTGSHTIFKLMKLAKDAGDATVRDFSKAELLERLRRIGSRKQKFDKTSYETNGESTTRANAVYKEVVAYRRALGSIAQR